MGFMVLVRFLIALVFSAFAAFSPVKAQNPAPAVDSQLTLSAVLEGDTAAIRSGLVWRVFNDPTDGTSARFVQESDEPQPIFKLAPGAYIVHVTYGLSGTTRRFVLGQTPVSEKIAISAGGLRFAATVGDTPISPEMVTFTIYVAVGNDPEGRVIAENVRPGTVVRLPTGTYRIVSRYGDTNAATNADLQVEAGKLIDVTMKHRAATITLKLVENNGGESIAGTAFSVLTPGGDTIKDLQGAFPSLILAEGEYVLIARSGGATFTKEFKVQNGLNADVEIVAKSGSAQEILTPKPNEQ